MADFTALKTAITNAIKQNGNQAITGNLLQEILIAMVESMGDAALNGLATSIQTSLDSLSAEDLNLENAISSEASTRQSADNTLSSAINSEALARENADTALQQGFNSAINSEALTRSQADTALQQSINNEAATRQGADTTLQKQITAEKNARVTDVSRLQGLIDAINAIVGKGYTFGGIATINGAPQQGKMFYIALERGNYINYGGVSVHNGITLIYNNGQWISKELLDLDVFYGEIRRIVNAYQPIVIEGDVTNAPDEEDLTSNNLGLLQFKNKTYAPIVFSGLGRKYLRKNIRPLTDSASFDGFVENVETEASLSGTPDAIFWDRINERFVGKKDDVYYQDWTDSEDYVPVSSELVYMNEGTPYRWDGIDLIVYDEIFPDLINMLTQDMINEENTIYHIQYDFTLGEDITVPANCVLEFDGGSISGEHTITGQNTGINAGLVKIFNTNVTIAGSWNVAEVYPEWFGAKGDGVTDDTVYLQKSIDIAKSIHKKIVLPNQIYIISDTLSLLPFTEILGGSENGWYDEKCTIIQTANKPIFSAATHNSSVEGVVLKDMTLQYQNSVVIDEDCIGIEIVNENSTNVTRRNWILENLFITNCYYGIYGYNTTLSVGAGYMRVKGCSIERNVYGVYLYYALGWINASVFDHTSFSNNKRGGAYFTASARPVDFINCTIEGNGFNNEENYEGFGLKFNCSGLINIKSCFFEGNFSKMVENVVYDYDNKNLLESFNVSCTNGIVLNLKGNTFAFTVYNIICNGYFYSTNIKDNEYFPADNYSSNSIVSLLDSDNSISNRIGVKIDDSTTKDIKPLQIVYNKEEGQARKDFRLAHFDVNLRYLVYYGEIYKYQFGCYTYYEAPIIYIGDVNNGYQLGFDKNYPYEHVKNWLIEGMSQDKRIHKYQLKLLKDIEDSNATPKDIINRNISIDGQNHSLTMKNNSYVVAKLINSVVLFKDMTLVLDNASATALFSGSRESTVIFENVTFKIPNNVAITIEQQKMIFINCSMHADNVGELKIWYSRLSKYYIFGSNFNPTIVNKNGGTQQNRNYASVEEGGFTEYFNTSYGFNNYWDGTTWRDGVGNKADINRTGTFANKPSFADIHNGFQYFNTDSHKMITAYGNKWYNPDGTEATA